MHHRVTQLLHRLTRYGFGVAVAIMALLALPLITDLIGLSIPGFSQAHPGVNFPRVIQNEQYIPFWGAFSCPAGYSPIQHQRDVCGRCREQSAWVECVNPAFHNPTPPPPEAPAITSRVCSPDGRTVNVTWNPSAGATTYYPRIGGLTQAQCAAIGWAWWTDNYTCYYNGFGGLGLTLPLNPGGNHSFWIHAGDPVDWNKVSTTGNFSCPLGPIGYLDAAQCPSPIVNSSDNYVRGWACDPSDFNHSTIVHIYRDGTPSTGGTHIGTVTANLPGEAAIGAQCGGNPNRRFVFQIPESLRDNTQHTYYAFGVDNDGAAGNPQLLNSNAGYNPNDPLAATCTIPTPTITADNQCVYDANTDTLSKYSAWTMPTGFTTSLVGIENPRVVIEQTATNYTFQNLAPGTTYRWWVNTKNTQAPNTPRNWSDEVGNTFRCPIPPPRPVSAMSAVCSNITNNTVRSLNLQAASRYATDFDIRIFRDTASNQVHSYTSTDDTPLNDTLTSATNNWLIWGAYWWDVRGVNTETGVRQESNWSRGYFECLPPPPVIEVTAAPSLVRSGAQAQLTWSVTAEYPLTCTVTGGTTNYTFTHTSGTTNNPNHPSPFLADPVSNTTNFTVSCTPQITGLTIAPTTRTARVEVVPTVQEI